MGKYILTSILLISFFKVLPQNYTLSNKHPIDNRLEFCLMVDSNQTTAGRIRCEAVAQREWDDEMNNYYKLLIDTLKGEEKTQLIAAQKAWLKYRDKEMSFSTKMYQGMEKDSWRVVGAGRSCHIVRLRALELKEYYEALALRK